MKSLHNSPLKVSSATHRLSTSGRPAKKVSSMMSKLLPVRSLKSESRNAKRMCEKDKGKLFINNRLMLKTRKGRLTSAIFSTRIQFCQLIKSSCKMFIHSLKNSKFYQV